MDGWESANRSLENALQEQVRAKKITEEEVRELSFEKAAREKNFVAIQELLPFICHWNEDILRTFPLKTFHEPLEKIRQFKKSWDSEQQEYVWTSETFARAAAFVDDLEILPWLHENGCPWDAQTFARAAFHGNLGILQWLYSQECPRDEHTFLNAAKHGNLENMKWLLSRGFPWDTYTFYYAAEHGNLENMKWLHENGCPWDHNTFMVAVDTENLEILTWLYISGCPYNKTTFYAAECTKNEELIKWITEILFPRTFILM